MTLREALAPDQTGRALADRLSVCPCRDCGHPFPSDPDADRCAECIADQFGESVQSNDQDAHLRRERALVATTGGYSNDGDPNA